MQTVCLMDKDMFSIGFYFSLSNLFRCEKCSLYCYNGYLFRSTGEDLL